MLFPGPSRANAAVRFSFAAARARPRRPFFLRRRKASLNIHIPRQLVRRYDFELSLQEQVLHAEFVLPCALRHHARSERAPPPRPVRTPRWPRLAWGEVGAARPAQGVTRAQGRADGWKGSSLGQLRFPGDLNMTILELQKKSIEGSISAH